MTSHQSKLDTKRFEHQNLLSTKVYDLLIKGKRAKHVFLHKLGRKINLDT